jgi:hypothetical protein
MATFERVAASINAIRAAIEFPEKALSGEFFWCRGRA